MKPSDSPRDSIFRDPTTRPFRDGDGIHHVFSYADVMTVLMNLEGAFSRDPLPWLPEGPHHMALDFMWAVEPFGLSGEEGRHASLRSVAEPWFRTRAVRTMESVIRGQAVELINGVVATGRGEFDLAKDLAYRLSLRVICQMVGIDMAQEEWMREKLDEFAQAPSYEALPLQWDAQAYFWKVVAERLAHPRDDLLDLLVDGWKTGLITDAELLGYMYGFVTAGSDTTGTSLVNALSLLSEFDQLDYARASVEDDAALRPIIEETLRFGTPFPTKPLYVLKPARFGDLVVPAGSILQIWFLGRQPRSGDQRRRTPV